MSSIELGVVGRRKLSPNAIRSPKRVLLLPPGENSPSLSLTSERRAGSKGHDGEEGGEASHFGCVVESWGAKRARKSFDGGSKVEVKIWKFVKKGRRNWKKTRAKGSPRAFTLCCLFMIYFFETRHVRPKNNATQRRAGGRHGTWISRSSKGGAATARASPTSLSLDPLSLDPLSFAFVRSSSTPRSRSPPLAT